MARQLPKTLQLVRGQAVLGTISVRAPEPGSPWSSGTFEASAAFEPVRELFETELRLLQANTTDDPAQWDEWESAHAELHDPGVRLASPDGTFVLDEILIHIDGTEAWWRVE